MKRVAILVAALIICGSMSAQSHKIVHNGYDKLVVSFSTPELKTETKTIGDKAFNLITLDGFGFQHNVGTPMMPSLTQIIEVPIGDGLTYQIEQMRCDTIDGTSIDLTMPIAPAQPSRSKSDTSRARLQIKEEAYNSNKFSGDEAITLNSIGIARNRNLANISFNPIKWNPTTNQLIVIREMTVTIRQSNADIAETRRMQSLHANPVFDGGIKAINRLGGKESYDGAPLRYTIVAHSMFRGQLDEFANWKRRKGFMVDLVYTDDANVGATNSSIRSYLQGLYDNATSEEPAPTFVLLVGDIEQIPAFYVSAYGSNQYSDLNYCNWTTGDNLPDCYYGRFSAKNASQLEAQINKTLMYEQYTFPDDSFLGKAALIAGVDGGWSSSTDGGYTRADPAMDYAARYYINSGNGFNNVAYYKNNTSYAPTGVTVTGSSQNSGTSSALISFYNNGCGWVNYSAHGSTTSWASPSLTTGNVSQLNNNNKPMFMIGNCCLTNSFQLDACFGEALLRKDNNAGAVVYIGASRESYWDEDFYWAVGVRTTISGTSAPTYDASHLGIYDCLFHTHGEAPSQWYTTASGIIYAGNMAVQNSNSDSDMKKYYWQIYHVMGDPSLMPYIHGPAAEITATMPDTLILGTNSIQVSTVPYAYIGMTDENYNLIGAAFADAYGNATLSISPNTGAGIYEVMITAQGYKPYSQPISIIPNGPFVNVISLTPSAELVAGKPVTFNATLKNNGIEAANDLRIEFQSVDNKLLLDTNGTVNLNASLSVDQEMSYTTSGTVWNNVADQSIAVVRAIVRWGNTSNDRSTKTFVFTVNAPKIVNSSHDVHGSFETDSTVTFEVTNTNQGHATLYSATVTLISLDPTIQIADNVSIIGDIQSGESFSKSYQLTCNGEVPEDRAIPVLQIIKGSGINKCDTLEMKFGESDDVITFEDGTWGTVSWTHGEYPWELTNQNAYEGTYCVKSKTWQWNAGNSQKSELSITWTSDRNDSISFYKKVSSETSYDKLNFYIDGNLMESSSGTDEGWTRSAYAVSAGSHTFKFSYEKDYSVSSGSDCAWLDNIRLPKIGPSHQYIIDTVCAGETVALNNQEINTMTLDEGFHYFCDTTGNDITHLTLYVTSEPTLSISGGDDTIRKGEGVRLIASGAERYTWSNGGNTPSIDVYPEETTTYSVTGYNGNCSASATTTVTVIGSLSITAPHSDNIAKVYPNPATDMLTVECPDMTEITITDITGRKMMHQKTNADKQSISITKLAKGIHFVTISTKNGDKETIKIIKK